MALPIERTLKKTTYFNHVRDNYFFLLGHGGTLDTVIRIPDNVNIITMTNVDKNCPIIFDLYKYIELYLNEYNGIFFENNNKSTVKTSTCIGFEKRLNDIVSARGIKNKINFHNHLAGSTITDMILEFIPRGYESNNSFSIMEYFGLKTIGDDDKLFPQPTHPSIKLKLKSPTNGNELLIKETNLLNLINHLGAGTYFIKACRGISTEPGSTLPPTRSLSTNLMNQNKINRSYTLQSIYFDIPKARAYLYRELNNKYLQLISALSDINLTITDFNPEFKNIYDIVKVNISELFNIHFMQRELTKKSSDVTKYIKTVKLVKLSDIKQNIKDIFPKLILKRKVTNAKLNEFIKFICLLLLLKNAYYKLNLIEKTFAKMINNRINNDEKKKALQIIELCASKWDKISEKNFTFRESIRPTPRAVSRRHQLSTNTPAVVLGSPNPAVNSQAPSNNGPVLSMRRNTQKKPTSSNRRSSRRSKSSRRRSSNRKSRRNRSI